MVIKTKFNGIDQISKKRSKKLDLVIRSHSHQNDRTFFKINNFCS